MKIDTRPTTIDPFPQYRASDGAFQQFYFDGGDTRLGLRNIFGGGGGGQEESTSIARNAHDC